jgi:hypothetical protein
MPVTARGKAKTDPNQLDLFSFTPPRFSANENTDAVRLNGREALAGVPPEDGCGTRPEGPPVGAAAGSRGENGGRNGRLARIFPATGINGTTGARQSLGNGAGEIHLSAARNSVNGLHTSDIEPGSESTVREPVAESAQPRNQNNYRITDADRIGLGSLKQKCRDNLQAIALLKILENEKRPPTSDEKRILVRYVGWGGLPQVFDSCNEQWSAEREKLESLLTKDELESARATTLNAHYTAPHVIRAMYSALERLGFTHGRILEPACGLGHFIGAMPDEMHSRSNITGVEIDSITARLTKSLYPDVDIRHQPFEEARLADNFYDVALSNIPFGDYKPFDARFKTWSFAIHDYFFAKALDKVRPGGLILFITSKGTMDKLDARLREYVSHQGDLLGAIRLPNDAFKKNANTEVTTDILVLRKRLPGELPQGPPWKGIAEVINSVGETLSVNEYFAVHPEMMLGEMRLEGRM